MGQCFGRKHQTATELQLAQQSHKQIELHLREDQTLKKRVFFTGSPECIMNIFGTIEGNTPIHQVQNSATLLIAGYLREYKSQFSLFIPSELQFLCLTFYGNIQPPNHYEFAPLMRPSHSPSYQSNCNASESDVLPFCDGIIASDTDTTDPMEKQIQYQVDFPQTYGCEGATQLNITYHNLQCFQKKKDYYLKWIHLLDNSLSVIFVADLSQLQDNLLLQDLEKFKRLVYYSNGKYDSKMPILVLSGIDKFNHFLSQHMYKTQFEAQFKGFRPDGRSKSTYCEQALQYIKAQYLAIFENNLVHGIRHWSKRQKKAQNLFIRTIRDVNDSCEVQNVWHKLNKTLIHQNIMHELRTGGIAL
eukprot:333206_1